jgi:hypothetical protein
LLWSYGINPDMHGILENVVFNQGNILNNNKEDWRKSEKISNKMGNN